MAGFRVRRGDLEMTIPDADSVVRFLRNGRLRETDEVLVDDRWVAISQAPPFRLHTRSADPWAAWSDADDVDAEQVLRDITERAPDALELPTTAVAPMPPPLEARKLEEIQHDELTPLEEHVDDEPTPVSPALPSARVVSLRPVVARPEEPPAVEPMPVVTPREVEPEPVLPPREVEPAPAVQPRAIPFRGGAAPRLADEHEAVGEVITFPRSRVRPAEVVSPRAPAPSPLIRPLRVATMVGLGMILLVGGWAWVRMEAGLAPASPVEAAVTTGEPHENRSGAGHQGTSVDATAAVEKQLRGVQLGDPRPVKKDGDLGDAILIDLQRLKVDILDVKAPVTQWSGKRAETPIEAEIHIQYRAVPGELDRELGAIAISVGRYININRLKVTAFDVAATTGEKTVLYPVDPQRAEDFARGRISLAQLMRT